MGLLSKFENKMEDGIEGAAGVLGGSSLSPVQITKKAEKQMRREKVVGAGKQYAPTLYTVLVSREDDSRMFKYYPTLAGETETYLMAKAREMGYVMDGQPLVRFLADPQLRRGKFEVVAEMVASSIVDQLRDDEMRRYGLPTSAGRRRGPAGTAAQRERNLSPQMQPLQNLQGKTSEDEADRQQAYMQQQAAQQQYQQQLAQQRYQQQLMMQQAQQAAAMQAQQASAMQAQQIVQPQAGQGAVSQQIMQPQAGQLAQDAAVAQQEPSQYTQTAYERAERLAQDVREQAQHIHRQALTADDMHVPGVLGSQTYEVPRDSAMKRGVSIEINPKRSSHGAVVIPEDLEGDLGNVASLSANLPGNAGAAPVVVMPAISEDVRREKASNSRGLGVDAIFGDANTARTADIPDGGPQAPSMQVYLYDEARDRAYELTGEVQQIGRESANSIVVPDINISRVHAEIHMQPNGNWVITDLGSTNGLYVNGEKVHSAQLNDADMITIGTSTLEFQMLS